MRRFTMASGNEEFGFRHGDGADRGGPRPVTSTTRYLSGAAYVDEEYADQIIDELVAGSHRAVAPAIGYDVVTVVRHCFRAQKLWLAQNAVLTGLLVVAAVLSLVATVVTFVLCL